MRIDPARLWDDLMAIGAITEPDRPWTRRSFSPLFLEGRAFLRDRLEAAGLQVRIDTAGNLIGRLEGREPGLPAIALGSHSDTVPAGGRFDGVAGVIAALEVARAIAEGGGLSHPIEVIDCLAEEPSDFGLSCIGSRGMTGQLTVEMLAMADKSGRTLGDALGAVGGDPGAIASAERSDLAAFLELHIEQGPVLEAERIDLGIVTAIVGIRRVEVEFAGEAAHAGTAPMHLRRDAGYAGARTIVRIRELAEMLAATPEAYFVATVGVVELRPGGSNVVPGFCRLVVDVRSSDTALTDLFMRTLAHDTLEIAAAARVERWRLEVLSDGVPAACDPRLRAVMEEAADALGRSTIAIASGAGHDAAFMARVCPAAMIFIPCLKGMSHNPAEYSSPEQVAIGTETLLETVRRLDRIL
ncbi:Zn-dependent hydrolase [Sphingomonas sp. CGMCC 1.13654]|uniref:Zn-dependent hydrolase n=1 Tax=Sphingomonas chungangi TaxID=2683589 RepID=A0A838L3P2_9SPHN|nr:Zn-dependent hydrolase [Sphingomonas chungangi]MBA2933540.1 Zn-dependent hydrolase [Sphingomonas chungangi]MVW54873.1 Zn-dependent hydrolase [Sphingomonas chungangi]